MTSPQRVCAVVAGGARSSEALDAVHGQSRPVDAKVLVAEVRDACAGAALRVPLPPRAGVAGAAHAGLRAGLAEGADWVWLLDGSAVPAPDALERLLSVLDELGALPRPALLAGTVVGADGEPHPDALPMNRLTHKEVVVEACRRRLVAVRAVRHGSILVSRGAIERDGLPRADYVADGDDLEWTARLLRDAEGYLVPASTALRRDPPSAAAGSDVPTARRLRNAIDMLRGPAWTGEEKLWMGFNAAAGLARGLRDHPGSTGPAARGIWAGLRSSGG